MNALNTNQGFSSVSYQTVPLPKSIRNMGGGSFVLDKTTPILFEAGASLTKIALFLKTYILQATGMSLNSQGVDSGDLSSRSAITLALSASITNEEGYELKVDSRGIHITGKTYKGVFYGVQTLRKSMPTEEVGRLEFPFVEIQDEPRFAYRGMHLDTARHFFPVSFVKEYIDLIALHGMNTFHWHLTEDQGWRIEIKKYPLLTSVGSVRKKTIINRSTVYDTTPHTGYYTQDECRQIVAYAKERCITVIPEIDMPGHMVAALAAYPELGCTGGPYEVCPRWGIMPDVLCAGNDKVYEFLEGVLDEIMDIFPSKYIHIGGDESPRDRWKVCPKCQERIRKEGLKGNDEHSAEDLLQSYFTARIERYLNSKGRSIIGWDEILNGQVAPNATVMSWRGVAGGIKAAQLDHDVIMTPTTFCYFDYYQSDNPAREPYGIGGNLPLEKVYEFDPVQKEMTPEQAKHVLGGQANLWTEYISTTAHAEYMVLPRMAAVAEADWMEPQARSYEAFVERLRQLTATYEALGYQYCAHCFGK